MSQRRWKRVGRGERAQALVEFAFALPVFLAIMLGIIDFARLLFTYASLSNASREMARVLSIPTASDAAAGSAFRNLLIMTSSVNNTSDTVTIGVTPSGGSTTSVTCYMNTVSGTTGISLTTSGSSTLCTLPSRTGDDDGAVTVAVSYHFQFSPLFQAPFNSGLLNPLTVLSTTAQAYIE